MNLMTKHEIVHERNDTLEERAFWLYHPRAHCSGRNHTWRIVCRCGAMSTVSHDFAGSGFRGGATLEVHFRKESPCPLLLDAAKAKLEEACRLRDDFTNEDGSWQSESERIALAERGRRIIDEARGT